MAKTTLAAVVAVAVGLGVCLFAGAASAACTVGRIAEMPVTMVGSRPLVQAKINGADATFLADSGAFFSMISTASALEYGLKLRPAPFGYSVRGIGGEADVQLTTVKDLSLLGTDLHNVDFLVGGSEVGAGAIGLIGDNLLRFEDVEFDLAGGAIRIFKSENCGGANLAYWSAGKPVSAMPIDPASQRHIIGSADVNGVRIRVVFDTGAARSFLTRAAALRAGIRTDAPDVVYNGKSSGVGRRRVDNWIAPVASFKVGDEEILHTRLRIGDASLGDADMLLGADFFLSHRVYVAKHQNRLFFTYNGGAVFNLDAPPPEPAAAGAAAPPQTSAADAPTDADGFSRRGEARAARGDIDGALADLDRACALAPGEARYAYERAVLHGQKGETRLARADLDTTLKLQPNHVRARIARAALNQAEGDRDAALADLDAADQAAARQADERLRMASEYERLARLPAAAAQFDLWIAAHGDDSRLAAALTNRCWVEALQGDVLDKAARDCEAARRALQTTARTFEGRGLVRLRQGDLAGAVADFNAALALQPKAAWALYGRGLAERRQGLATQATADISAAVAIQPELAAVAMRRGLVAAPPGDRPTTAAPK